MAIHDDSTGKHKFGDARARSAVLSAVFIVGLCIGVIASEKIYLNSQESQTPSSAFNPVRLQQDPRALSEVGSTGRSAAVLATNVAEQAGLFQKNREPRNELEMVLQRVAPDGEVIIAISNMNLIHEESLLLWLKCMGKIESKNWMVVAIDEELRDYCVQHNINHYYRPVVIPDTQKDTGSNHAVSAMKYEIIEEFLTLGWNVLLSDVDVVTVQDPTKFLYRDSDVEGMSDGFDDETNYGGIYGVDEPSMGWSRYAQGFRHMALNSGLFYLRASERTIDLMRRIADRLHKESAWDQSVYNEVIFTLSHGEYKSPQVSVRVMEREKFMNSRVLFKQVRKLPKGSQPRPVMVHMNYHPDKTDRMKGAIKYYLEGQKDALDAFPGGSEPGT